MRQRYFTKLRQRMKTCFVVERWFGPTPDFPNARVERSIGGRIIDVQPNVYHHSLPPFQFVHFTEFGRWPDKLE